jgi:hypothetical protein
MSRNNNYINGLSCFASLSRCNVGLSSLTLVTRRVTEEEKCSQSVHKTTQWLSWHSAKWRSGWTHIQTYVWTTSYARQICQQSMHGSCPTDFSPSTTIWPAAADEAPDLPREEAVGQVQTGEVPTSAAQRWPQRIRRVSCTTLWVSNNRWTSRRPLQLSWTGITNGTTPRDVSDMTSLDARVEVCSGHMKILALAALWNIPELPPADARLSKTCGSKLRLSVFFLLSYRLVQSGI